MLIGFEESVKSIKRALSVTGGESDVFRSWSKSFDKVRKQFESSYTNYHSAKDSMEDIHSMLIDLEKLLVETREWQKESLRQIEKTVKEMKRQQGKQYHVLLVGADHTDYRTTYESIIRLGLSFDGADKSRIMLQSEVENLLAIIKEAKEHKNPNTNHLAYLEAYGRLDLIQEVAYDEKLVKMANLYEEEFYGPIRNLLISQIQKADEMLQEGITGFGAARKEEALGFFVEKAELSPEERAMRILKDIA